jgi:hypothetical protein
MVRFPAEVTGSSPFQIMYISSGIQQLPVQWELENHFLVVERQGRDLTAKRCVTLYLQFHIHLHGVQFTLRI